MCTSRDPIFLISSLSLARLTLVKACQFSGRACVHEEVDSASSFDFGILCLKRDHAFECISIGSASFANWQ